MQITKKIKLQKGITLIESLVAIVVMALGILGILGVQMRTLSDTQTGVRRAQAIRLIEDLSERVQNNPDALNNFSVYAAASAPAAGDCATAACTPSALAAYELDRWKTNVANTLPSGTSQIYVPQNGTRQLGVLVSWRESQYNQDGKELSSTDSAAMKAPFGISDTKADGTAVTCPANSICHLQYIQPVQRCTPWNASDVVYCPN